METLVLRKKVAGNQLRSDNGNCCFDYLVTLLRAEDRFRIGYKSPREQKRWKKTRKQKATMRQTFIQS